MSKLLPLVTHPKIFLFQPAVPSQNKTRHRASTSMYSRIYRVRVTTPPAVWTKWSGARSVSMLSPVRGVFAGMHSVHVRHACGMCAACGGPGGLPLGSATHFCSVAIATQPVH